MAPKLEIVGEFDPGNGFGKKFGVLSCGHMRRQGEPPDRESGADGNLPADDVVWCWQGCHERDE